MAQPPTEIEPTQDVSEILERLWGWPGLRGFAGWAIEDAEVLSYEQDLTQLTLRLVAEPGRVNPSFSAALELEWELLLLPDTGELRHPEHAANLIEDVHTRLSSLIARAVEDTSLSAWLADNPTAIARFEDLGGADRLAFRGGASGHRFFPEIG